MNLALKLKSTFGIPIMSTMSGTIRRHKFHGDPKRFGVISDFVAQKYGKRVKYIADVAGGQGMLTRMLRKKNYEAEVVDPRGWTLKGVPSRTEEFSADMADYYDLIIGLHPDKATRAVAESAKVRPVILITCCNFWDKEKVLGRNALIAEIEKYYDENGIKHERITFDFKGPMNVGIISEP